MNGPVRTLAAKVFFSLITISMLGTMQARDSNGEKQSLPDETSEKSDIGQLSGAAEFSESHIGFSLLKNITLDQKTIWTSPFHLHWEDGAWLFPFATVTALSIATDRSFVRSLSSNPQRLNRYTSFSNDGVAALAGVAGGSYLWSYISHDDHERETGILTGEAALDSLLTAQALKYSFGRERPAADQGRLDFFKGGNSFPSDHAAAAWSTATLIANEYPGLLTKTVAYGLATAVTASVVLGKDHSPSDALVGSAMGWLIGRYVYRAHHDPDLAGGTVGDLPGKENPPGERQRQDMGSPFVPLDSWVYSTFERLAAMRYVNSAILGLKPWTRMECARLAEEAAESLEAADKPNAEAAGLVARLQREFGYEVTLLSGGRNVTANVDSVYVRTVSISGPALTDSYHFGQTVAYDFGRPFERGTNGQAGGSFDASAGPLTIYMRAEYQHAPAAPAYSENLRAFIAHADYNVPLSEVPPGGAATTNQAQLLDAYAAVDLHNFELAVGRQSLSWAPGPDSMMWSDNIEPVSMIRLVNPEPFLLPGFLRHLGPVRIDQFFGRLEGHPYVPNPFVYGQKINVRLFPFLELGFGRRSMIGGTGGDALTTGNLVRSLVGVVNPRLNSVPGDNESEMDWTFYLPKVRNYIVLYGDAYAEDDILPIENPARVPWHPGVYITRIPGIPKLDLHVEGVSTEQGGQAHTTLNLGQYNYINGAYPDGNTNRGNLIGNSVGRDGRAIQSWLNYWLSPRNTLQLLYRRNSVAADYVPGGAAWQDYAFSNQVYWRSGVYLRSEVQYEHISRYPLLFARVQQNVTAILELGLIPERKK